ncbi:MAG: PD-(D/E)XK nuclease family protein [Candidatus Thermoplasmatota archaeon]|nr:PD-(D/E)XK nuclease family protein [Candidatus Thermoplasmatota archaeon]
MSATTWSHTRLSTYLACPCAYKLRYIAREPQVASPAMLAGQQMHEALERYALVCWRKGKRPLKTDFDAGRDIAAGYPDLQRDIERWVENTAWEWGVILPGDTSPVEQMYQGILPNGDLFTGRIDLLQRYGEGIADDPFAESADLWVLTDWKSGWGAFSEDGAPLQLLAYAWLVQWKWPEAREFELRIEAVRAPWSPKPWRVSGDLEWVAEQLAAMAERIKRDRDFEAHVGEACMNCTVVAACPHVKSATMEALREDPRELARQVALLEAAVAQGKRLLKQAVKDNGPVPVGEGREAWGWTRKESLACGSPRTAAETIEAAGGDPWEFVSMTPAQFAKALEAIEDDEARAALVRLGETKVKNEFGLLAIG